MGELDSTDSQLSGKTLGTFTLQRLLGRGGMGAVYLAQQSRPRRTVAVKVLLPELFQNSTGFNEFLVRFRREADAIAALDHINIMPIYEYGEQDRLAYLVMPYVAGGTLRDIVGERGKLPISETTTIVEQIAAALDYAHQHGIIHRDLKPGNILFHADGRLLLTDFGIAKVLGDPATANVVAMQTLTMAGMIIGTPEYLSPEQAAGAPIDNRSDVYALGIVLFQLLSGRVPFTGTTPVAVAIKHATQAPPSLSQLNPAIPPGVEHVIVKALAKKPEQRYATAGELARELRAAVTDYQPAVKVSLLSTDETMLDTIPPVRGKQIYESTVATNRPNDELTVATNRPSDEPAVATNRQPRKRQGGRLPLWLALLSGILVVLLILGGSALYLHWLPGGNQQPSGSTKNQATSTPTPKSSATVSHPQTRLPSPAIAVGKLLYGTSLPLCDGQSSLWNTNPSLQSTCDAADTRLTNTNAGQVEGDILKTFPGNASIPNDYVLEVQVKPVSASSGAFGIFFRTQSGANHQGGFSFTIQPSGQWNGNSIDDTTGQATSLFGLQGTALNSTGFTTIDIVVNGNIFQLYFNGARQGGISSSSYPTGNLGLAVGGGSDVLFKNLAIYALP
ncbi:MAG TPA: protein kinase [Ktedonobacteraceae bacterium]|nr:protein kinase [Ktedonobacteraceae bacterium]